MLAAQNLVTANTVKSKEDFLKRYYGLSKEEEKSLLARHKNVDSIEDALNEEYEWYIEDAPI